MSIWGLNMDEVIGGLRSQKISIGLAVGVLWMAWIGYTWVFETFATKAEASENAQDVQKTLNNVERTLNGFVAAYEIREATKTVEVIETQLWHTEQHIREHGASPETDAKLIQLQRRLVRASNYRDCLLANRPNCEHLR